MKRQKLWPETLTSEKKESKEQKTNLLDLLDPVEQKDILKDATRFSTSAADPRFKQTLFSIGPVAQRNVRKYIYSFVPGTASKECSNMTYQGKNCFRALRYRDKWNPGDPIDCSKYCVENCQKWIKDFITKAPEWIMLRHLPSQANDAKVPVERLTFALRVWEMGVPEKKKRVFVSRDFLYEANKKKWFYSRTEDDGTAFVTSNIVQTIYKDYIRMQKSVRAYTTKTDPTAGMTEMKSMDEMKQKLHEFCNSLQKNPVNAHINVSIFVPRPDGFPFLTEDTKPLEGTELVLDPAQHVAVQRFVSSIHPSEDRYFQAPQSYYVGSVTDFNVRMKSEKVGKVPLYYDIGLTAHFEEKSGGQLFVSGLRWNMPFDVS